MLKEFVELGSSHKAITGHTHIPFTHTHSPEYLIKFAQALGEHTVSSVVVSTTKIGVFYPLFM